MMKTIVVLLAMLAIVNRSFAFEVIVEDFEEYTDGATTPLAGASKFLRILPFLPLIS
jgi:hypothetical protein